MPDTTFDVSPDVAPPQHARADTVDYISELRTAFRRPIEATWLPTAPLIACDRHHALVTAMSIAFFGHRPLRLSPDAIWITLVRGFALHINEHAEKFRHRFVSHSGREKLVVDRPDFKPGADNPWPEAFAEFGRQIDERTGGAAAFVRTEFSTTGPVQRAVADLMLMETCKAYFEYQMYAGCGVPYVTLTGTLEDWQLLRKRARSFAEFGLEDWVAALDPVLAEFELAKAGNADRHFWQSMYRYHSGSGPAVMTGWATVLFPYFKQRTLPHRDTGPDTFYPNPYLHDWRERLAIDDSQDSMARRCDPQGDSIELIPPCYTSVPLKLFWGTTENEMRLVGGLLGVVQHEATGAVEPECGWMLLYENPVDPPQRFAVLDLVDDIEDA